MYTINGVEKIQENEKEIQSIPCKINYNGPANVSERFIREKDESIEKSSFRGRGLEGAQWSTPEGYSVYVLKERNGRNGKILDIEAKSSTLTVWEWDRTCGQNGERTSIATASNYLKIASALAEN